MNNIFGAADILLPKTNETDKWAVIACDQFTSEKEYFRGVPLYLIFSLPHF